MKCDSRHALENGSFGSRSVIDSGRKATPRKRNVPGLQPIFPCEFAQFRQGSRPCCRPTREKCGLVHNGRRAAFKFQNRTALGLAPANEAYGIWTVALRELGNRGDFPDSL